MTLTTLLIQFQTISIAAVGNLKPYALSTFYALMTLDFLWSCIKNLAQDEGGFSSIINSSLLKFVKYGFWLFVINNYVGGMDLLNAIKDSFITIGTAAGGNTASVADISNPSAIITQGFTTLDPVKANIKNISLMNLSGPIILLLVGYLATVLAFFIIAWQLFITLAEFYIITSLLLIFFPFAVFDKTAFLAEKAISAIVGLGVRLAVLAFILSIANPLLQTPLMGTNEESLLIYTSASLGLALLCWQAPGLAGGLMAGSPSLSGSGMIAGGAGAAMGAGNLAKSGYSMVKGGGAAAGTSAYQNAASASNNSTKPNA